MNQEIDSSVINTFNEDGQRVVLFYLRLITILANISQLNKMEAIAFVKSYMDYLEEINSVIKPELQPLLDELRQIDPHDLVSPESYFTNENQARGFVWSMFLKRAKKYNQTK